MSELTFRAVSQINGTRCERWHPGFPDDGNWLGSDWSNAMAGEAGETCNVVKKLRRIEAGMQQAAGDTRADLLAKLATEIGDTFIYLDLLAQYYGLDIRRCVVDTFNRVSEREGFPERLPALCPEIWGDEIGCSSTRRPHRCREGVGAHGWHRCDGCDAFIMEDPS